MVESSKNIKHDVVQTIFKHEDTQVSFPAIRTVVFKREDFIRIFKEVKPNGS